MADKDDSSSNPVVSGLNKVLNELKDPLDWAAAFIGGAGGAAITVTAHGLDLGHSIPTGALAAVGCKKAIFASFQRPRLGKKAERLKKIIETQVCIPPPQELPVHITMAVGEIKQTVQSPPYQGPPKPSSLLLGQLQDAEDKWKARILSNDAFNKILDDISDRHTELRKEYHAKFSGRPDSEDDDE